MKINSIYSLLLVLFLCLLNRELVCNCDGVDVHVAKCVESDREALIDVKEGLDDPMNSLSSWSGEDCCQWKGVRCDNNTGAVVAIALQNYDSNSSRDISLHLSGNINPALLRLNSLRHLNLSLNSFQGTPIPEFFCSFRELRYLDLSYTQFGGLIPPCIGNISSLQYFDVSNYQSALRVNSLAWLGGFPSLRYLGMNGVDLSTVSPNSLQVLNRLPSLNELHLSFCKLSGFLPSLPHVNMTSLAVVDLSMNKLYSTIPDWIVNISSLVHLDLSANTLHGKIPLDISELPNLRHLVLSSNQNLTADCSTLLTGSWRRIEVLEFVQNNIYGTLPSSIGNITSLVRLKLFDNNVEGELPKSIGSLCNLEELTLTGNNLSGEIPQNLVRSTSCISAGPLPSLMYLRLSANRIVGELPEWLGQLVNLVGLDLKYNFLHGAIPASLGRLSLLSRLSLGNNELNGTLPPSLGQLSSLTDLDVSSNRLTGNVSEIHFLKLKNLNILQMSSNSLVFNVSSDWVPPFHGLVFLLRSCKLSPFPFWLSTQRGVVNLDISNASISGDIPSWFWNLSSNFAILNMSLNQLQGQVPNLFKVAPTADVDFSSNLLEGPVPLPASDVDTLELSNNRFTGPIPPNIGQILPNLKFFSLSNNSISGKIPVSVGDMMFLQVLDLSRNNLTAGMPSTLHNQSYLEVIDLSYNNLSGLIPSSYGQLKRLKTLRLSNNLLSGELPSSLRNCSDLETLDLGNNYHQGSIPPWVGESLIALKILRLRSNLFSGTLPPQITNLTSLQVLDLADNNLVGSIPDSLRGLKAMLHVQTTNNYRFYGNIKGVYYEESLVVSTKYQSLRYTKTLSLVISIDLSGNNLDGEFPESIAQLQGLVFLNLSRNRLSGKIPEAIGNLRALLSLDVSLNQISGGIPPIMTSMSGLSYLNLSNNNLSGRIPSAGQLGTFDESTYSGNPKLCGSPLPIKCQPDNPDKGGTVKDDTDNVNRSDFIDQWFYLSIGFGFATGLLVPFVVLIIERPWSDAYFGFVDKFIEKALKIRANTAISSRSLYR